MKRIFSVMYFMLAAMEGAICAIITLSIASSAKVILGYSLARLLLAGGILFLSVILFALAWRSWARPPWVESVLAPLEDIKVHTRILSITLLLFVFTCTLFLLPGYWFHENAALLDRLRPLILWLALILGQSVVALLALKWALFRASLSTLFNENKPLLRVTGIILAVFLLAWILIALTRIGLVPDVAAWNETGVPILGLQILSALLLSLGISYALIRWQRANYPITRKLIGKISVVDLALCAAIWALAAGIWLAEPMPHSYNAPRPSPPNNEFYPFSDAVVYDVGGQYTLIGQGINNQLLTDKPFYMFFLSLLHAIGGQSYTVVIGLQVMVLAVLPVILYLFGKEMFSRGAGILIALLSIFKERNAIASALDIQVSHSKLMLTEMPTALAVAIFAFLMFQWLKNTSRPRALPLWAGGMLGVAALIRPNPLLLLPFALLAALIAYGRGWRRGVIPAVLLMIGFSLVVSPWLLTNRNAQGRTYIQVKLDGILNRYKWQFPDGSKPMPTPQSGLEAAQLAMLDQFSYESPLPLVQATIPSLLPQEETEPGTAADGPAALEFVPAHFLHNEITAIFILPLTWSPQDLPHTLATPFWNRQWAGAFTLENGLLLFINLCLIAFGIAVAWRRWRTAGLVPVFVETGYFLANALARTSGSRYLVPVDWVIYFYFGLGLFQLAVWILSLTGFPVQPVEKEHAAVQSKNDARLFWAAPMLALLSLGLLLPLSGAAIPPRYPSLTKSQAFEALQQQVSLSELGLDEQKIDSFISNPKSVVFQARALYPRYFPKGEGLCTRCYVLDAAFQTRPIARLSFVAIGPYSAGVFIEMRSFPKDFRNSGFSDAPDAWVIGCVTRAKSFHARMGGSIPVVRGIAVVVTGRNGVWFYTQPHPNLECK